MRHALFLSLFLLAASLSLVDAAKSKIGPGRTEILPEERAIESDPAGGIENAVILLEEIEIDESNPNDVVTRYHRRVKILSNEGRSQADVEFTVFAGDDKLKEWWGRTLLPDGSVLEVSKEELERESLAKTRGAELVAVKAALPGVVPGCVIDYGYTLRGEGLLSYDRIPLQREWLVRDYSLNWKPYMTFQAALQAKHSDNLDVKTEKTRDGFLVRGRNLPPVEDEPLMPPDSQVRASVVRYYVTPGNDFDDFWHDVAVLMERDIRDSTSKKKSLERALQEMNLPAEAPLDAKLRAAYEWIGANIVRTGLRSFEQKQQDAGDDKKEKRDIIAQVLDTREGDFDDIHYFFIGVARALGAEAHLVFLADRTLTYWDPQLKSEYQFDSTAVAVRPPGAGDDQMAVTDPGSGLPYGHIPWWLAGPQGLLLDSKKARPIRVPVSQAKDNTSETVVVMSFSEDNESLLADWSRTGKGQTGVSVRRRLRRLSPDERTERLDQLCGAGPEVDVLEANVAALEDLSRELELQCKLEDWSAVPDGIGEYLMGIGGPWVRGVPDLPDEPRKHMILFDYPRMDIVRLEITSPEGFVPGRLPRPVARDTEFGRYQLKFSTTDTGFRMERAFALYPIVLPKEKYAALQAFLEQVRSYDRSQISFVSEKASR